LRPNKAVDREIFLALLGRLAASVQVEGYSYIGLGGPLLEDFRLLHARLGIAEMFCVESDPAVHRRQVFNRPAECIECVLARVEDFIDEQDFGVPTIIWLDYTRPRQMAEQIQRFAETVGVVAPRSILRITLNAHAPTLGLPPGPDIAVRAGDLSAGNQAGPTVQEWRLDTFRSRLGSLAPGDLTANSVTGAAFGKTVLRALKLAVERETFSLTDRTVVWAFATEYADGQTMVTATLVVCGPDDTVIADVIEGWEFRSSPDTPHVLSMPALSTLERLTLARTSVEGSELLSILTESGVGEDSVASLQKFGRMYPHFSRVDL